DIEAEEREGAIVIEAGNGRGRRAVELADKKSMGIDGVETRGVAQPGIPAFARGPIHRDGNLLRPHRANAQISGPGHCALLASERKPLRSKAESISSKLAGS